MTTLVGYASEVAGATLSWKVANRNTYLLVTLRECHSAWADGYSFRQISDAVTNQIAALKHPLDADQRALSKRLPLSHGGSQLTDQAIKHRVHAYQDLLKHGLEDSPEAAEVSFRLCSGSGATLRFRRLRDAMVNGGLAFQPATVEAHNLAVAAAYKRRSGQR